MHKQMHVSEPIYIYIFAEEIFYLLVYIYRLVYDIFVFINHISVFPQYIFFSLLTFYLHLLFRP